MALAQSDRTLRIGDYIVAVVNSELVTANEVEQRSGRVRDEARRGGGRLPPGDVLRKQVVDSLIDERVLVTYARDSGMKVDEAELDRAVSSVAANNRVTLAELRRRLQAEGIEFSRFRSSLRDQILVERVREREVQARIRISDAEIDKFIEQQRGAAEATAELNLAQILVTVPEGASEAQVAERRARIDAALARVQGGADFATVAREVSEDGNRANGGVIGLRPSNRLPDLFVEATKNLKAGEVTAQPIKSGAGFHLLKVVERRDGQVHRVNADAGAAHSAAHFGAGQRAGRGAPARRPEAPDRRRPAALRRRGARGVRRRQRSQWRRTRLGVAGWFRARVRRGDEPLGPERACRRRCCRASACT